MKKKTVALSLIIALELACTLWIIPIRTVESQSFETIYIGDDGSVQGTDLIEIHDNTYTFLNDISGNIVISKDFITIDGSGCSLIGTDNSSQKGISLSDRKNVTVTNLVIMNYFIGISCGGTASNITILNNSIDSCGIGIEFLGSSNNLVKYNTFKNNDIDIAINYVSGNNLITIAYNNLNDYIQVWMSEQQTINMNYWSDYNGEDSDGDGVGDSPYFYNEILQDNHPLMEPVVLPTPTPTSRPTNEPTSTPYNEPTGQEVILGVAITIAVLGVGLGLLVYLIKRK
jgi:parallel beta-helix repeat protein